MNLGGKVKKLLLIALAPFLLSFSTCGRKGDPLPPFSFFPQTPTGLKAKQIGNRVLVSWNPSKFFTDGRKIKEEEKISYLIKVNFGDKLKETKRTYLLDEKKHVGEKICYSVASKYGSKYASAFSEPICLEIRKPIDQIPIFSNAEAGDGFVKITFKPHKFKIAIYKTCKAEFPIRPYRILNPEEFTFIDTNVQNGREYKYFARFIFKNIESRNSQIITLTPMDTEPPEPPKNLEIVRENGKRVLIWEPSRSEDVKLYKIVNNGKVVGMVSYGLYFPLKNLTGCFQVIAVDKANNTASSKKICLEEK